LDSEAEGGEGNSWLAQGSSCIFGEEAGAKLGKSDADVSAGASSQIPNCGSAKTWFVGGL
jgi:hypothetical protein